jgi:NAD-dependent DNA ligase
MVSGRVSGFQGSIGPNLTKNGSKAAKATELGVRVLSEAEFRELAGM